MSGFFPDEDEWYPDSYAVPFEEKREHERWRSTLAAAEDRTVTYLVLVDGRVIDHWDEPMRRSPWKGDPRVERTLRPWRGVPVEKPAKPPWQATIEWLEHLVGGQAALRALSAEPLPDEAFELPERAVGDGDLVARFRQASQILDGLADHFFEHEVRTAFRRALAKVGVDLFTGRQADEALMVAAGICWAVAKANGVVSPVGRVTLKSIAAQLHLSSFPSAKGKEVARLLGTPQPPWVQRPAALMDLEPLSSPELLCSRVRHNIVALRDAAVAAESHVAAHERLLRTDPGSPLPEAS